MEMIPVDSSNLSAIGYDYETATLRIDFLKGRSYEYYGVPAELYEGLLSAGSKGQYLNMYIKSAGFTYSPI
ncbi:KTSC domain-containing protein [Altibacter sp. HG106]|uniref:KTSC domain-containing protein n=1 Tax=Altibacter sp. HG106 TaxID=3023937 RepID=UPI00234FC14D|nr:KTSC domain-containing protein [Altibacter sp. HG106]MDC7995325.1 KTSC domain-containing protein [Altibacter sp. HG106]